MSATVRPSLDTRARAARLRCALLALLALTTGCWPGGSSSAPTGAGKAEDAGAPATTGATMPALPDDPLAGTWWVLMPDRPYIAFCLNLVPARGDHVEGSWTSFDWRGSRQADDLRHRSKGVKVTGELDDDALTLTAPAPMLDANGNPNGQRGTWHLDVKGSNLPGEPRRYAGHATSTDSTDAAGIPVTLEREFRPWKP